MKNIELSNGERTVVIKHDTSIIPTQVTLINKVPAGSGDAIVESGMGIEKNHPDYILEYGESSAKLADAHFEKSDPTIMYSFGVGKEDLVFHKHAGRRAITGITGSGGAVLKFSFVADEGPSFSENFFNNMVIVYVPADTQFILKFDGRAYHQFGPADPAHNAFFAVSVHPQEDRDLTGIELERVRSNQASIPLLTIPASGDIMKMLDQTDIYQTISKVYLKSFKS